MRKPVFIVDAFTDKPFAGNPAGVMLDGAELESPQLKAIASELRASETSFVLPAREPQDAFHLRWFTAGGNELAFCGHGTLAALHVLVEEAKRIRVPEQGVQRLSFGCKAGRVRVELSREAGKLRARFEAPLPQFANAILENELLAILGLLPELLDPNLPPATDPRGVNDELNLHLAVRDREVLARVKPDFKALASYARAHKLGAVCVYAAEPQPGVDAALRYFVPHYGIDEDPVTGSACARLACLLQMKLPEEMPRKMVFLQGKDVGRPGRVEVEVRPEETPGVIRGWISGDAIIVLRGELVIRK